jgi:hypothetical protein
MSFFVSAESGVDSISEPRQTEPAAIGLALDYIDRGFFAVAPVAVPSSARSSYWHIRPFADRRNRKDTPALWAAPLAGDQDGRLGVSLVLN